MTEILGSLDDLAARVPDGALLALPPEYSFVPMALIRALIRRGAKDLHILTVPIGGMAADMLIGAGCVKRVECAAVTLGEVGLAPRFSAAVEQGRVEVIDSTCPAVHTALQATEKGVPFMPLGGLIGSDIVKQRNDWKVVDDPLGRGNGKIVLIPAIQPDVAVIHSPLADRDGNVWIGRRRELATIAHAARTLLVTVERVQNESLLASEATAAGALPGLYVSALAEAPMGAKPLGLVEHYEPDHDELACYGREARSEQGFRAYLERTVFAGTRAAAE
ncbi:MAG: CoA synthetase [Proteobacteria bacterium]|nr:CoA synthetase [Pseudomonadota bacterium]